jgi:hypothetical protein
LTDLDAQLEQLAVDPRRTPQDVVSADALDKVLDVRWNRKPSGTARARFPRPECPKAQSVPPDDGLRLDDRNGVKAARPKTIEQNPKGSVQLRQLDAGSLVASKNLDLVAKSGHLQLQIHASSEAGKEAMENGNYDPAHDLNARVHAPRKARISTPDRIYGRDRPVAF